MKPPCEGMCCKRGQGPKLGNAICIRSSAWCFEHASEKTYKKLLQRSFGWISQIFLKLHVISLWCLFCSLTSCTCTGKPLAWPFYYGVLLLQFRRILPAISWSTISVHLPRKSGRNIWRQMPKPPRQNDGSRSIIHKRRSFCQELTVLIIMEVAAGTSKLSITTGAKSSSESPHLR